jgi:hypothetical protein
MTVEALPGYVRATDTSGHVHTISIHGMRTPVEAGPQTVFVRVGARDVFVPCSIAEFRIQVKRARTLRKAKITTQQRAQLELDFGGGRGGS